MGDDIEERYRYFSDSSITTRLGNQRLYKKMRESGGDAASSVSAPDLPAWSLHNSPLSSPDKYYFFGGYIPSPAREKGKSRPAILAGEQTFTATNWETMERKRATYLAEKRRVAGIRLPPRSNYNDDFLNWRDQAQTRKEMKDNLPPQPRLIPQATFKGPETRQPINMAKSAGGKVVSTSNGENGMRQSIEHIFPQGHVTYDKLFKEPWAYNDQMRVTGTTHNKSPLELNC